MGRKRTLTRADLFAAVERVVRAHGPLGTTIEAVAREAGVSKATVLYDYQSKTDLLLAFLGDLFQRQRDALEDRATQAPDPDRAWLEGLVAQIGRAPSDEDRFAAAFVTEALKPDNPCRDILRNVMADDMQRIIRVGPDPRMAVLAHLALHGLASTTAFGAADFTPPEREAILDDILHLACDGQLRPLDARTEGDAPRSPAYSNSPTCPNLTD